MGTQRYSWNSAEFGHLLQRYRNTYRLPESPEDVERHLRQIMEHIDGLINQARDNERRRLLAMDTGLETLITDVITTAVKEAVAQPGGQQLIQDNATTYLLNRVRLSLGEQLRQARLDEHKILATLDEEGRKQRYLELSNE